MYGALLVFLPFLIIGMVKITNVFGDIYSGTVDKKGTFATWKGRNYRRKYVVPTNPNSPAQQTTRGYMTAANVLWKTFTPLLKSVYGFLVTKLNISGWNLLSQRYIHRGSVGGTLPIAPKHGQKTVGISGTEEFVDEDSVAAASSGTLTIPATKVMSYDEGDPAAGPPVVPGFLNDGVTPTGCKGFVCETNGAIKVITAITGGKTMYVSYEVNGRIVTDENLGTPGAGTYVHLKYHNIKANSVKVYEGIAGDTHEAELSYLAFNANDGKWYTTDAVVTAAGATVDFTAIKPVALVKLESVREGTSDVTFRGYATVNGRVDVGYTVYDENYDTAYTFVGYTTHNDYGDTATNAALNETISLVAL